MQLYEEMLIQLLKEKELIQPFDPDVIIRDRAYDAMCRIKRVLENDMLTDDECFWKIEEIVRIFEEAGSDAGTRHDFG